MTQNNLISLDVTNLIPVAFAEREAFFLNDNNEVDPLIEEIKNHYSSISFEGMDGSTATGRTQLKKLSADLNKKITEIDNQAKEVLAILKAKPNKVTATRNKINEELRALYDEIRKPAVDWDNEQAKIKAEEKRKLDEERAEQLRIQREKDQELEALRAQVAAEKERVAIAEAAAQKARLEAENQATAAKLELERERLEQERAEALRIENQRKLEALQQEEKRKKEEEEQQRLNDKNHRKKINNEALEALKTFGVTDEVARNILILIINNKVPHVSISY